MKFFSFKIFILFILLPPVLYIFSLEIVQKVYIENYLTAQYTREIENINIGDTRPLLTGSVHLKDALYKNITNYVKSKKLIALGIKAKITVVTKGGTILFPPIFEVQKDFMAHEHLQVAAENLKLMDEGLLVKLELRLEYYTLLSFLILAFYMAVSLGGLYLYYKAGIRKARREEIIKNKEIGRLLKQERIHSDKLKDLENDRHSLTGKYEKVKKSLEKEKAKAIRNEDEMVDEIISLEEKISHNIALQEEQKDEINDLKEKISQFEKGKKKDGFNKKESKIIQKRLKTLYKNVIFHDKTFSGFTGLNEDLKIKSEELIHQLNDKPDLVSIKRKVFGKKGRQTVLEVVFGYKGRLYFRKTKEGKIQVLTVGTKNTQPKDLEFLNNL